MRYFVLLLLAIFCESGLSQRLNPKDAIVIIHSVIIVNERGDGIESDVDILDVAGKLLISFVTNQKGEAQPKIPCATTSRVRVRPKVSIYHEPRGSNTCSEKMRFQLRLRDIHNWIIDRARLAEGEKNFRLATMLYTEAAWRLSDVDQVQANEIQGRAYQALRFVIAPTLPADQFARFDALQGQIVLTQRGGLLLRKYQTTHGLKARGVLDYPTARSISRRPVYPYIREAYDELVDDE